MRGADGVTDEGVPAQSGTGAEGSVTEVVRRRWGVALGGVLPARFLEPGWAYEEGGSVLVFCGSKRRVRATALALAADRGVPTTGVDADDAELVERLCTKAGVRLHHRDWPYKREAEQAFRTREADILVATSGWRPHRAR